MLAPTADDVTVVVVVLLIPIVSGPFIFEDPEINNDPVIINVSTLDLNNVPKLPVRDKALAVTAPVTNNEFNVASEPDTMTFFQFGILYFLLDCG